MTKPTRNNPTAVAPDSLEDFDPIEEHLVGWARAVRERRFHDAGRFARKLRKRGVSVVKLTDRGGRGQ